MNRQDLLRQWWIQVAGVFVLVVVAWAFLNTPDQKGWNLALSALLALLSILLATALIAWNFSRRRGLERTQLLWVAAALVTMLMALFLLSQAEVRWSGQMSTWLASAISLQRKKPLLVLTAYEWLAWTFFLVRWIVIPLLFIPLFVRAVGSRLVIYRRFILIYLGAFLVGAVLPHYIVHWVPKLPGFWPQVISAAIRFLVAYLILISAWVLLGRLCREEAPSQSIPIPPVRPVPPPIDARDLPAPSDMSPDLLGTT